MRFFSAAILIMMKDLKEEVRRKENILASLFFSFISLVLLHFSVGGMTADMTQAGPGILWLITIFAGSLFMGNIFRKEEENGTFCALLIAPSDSGSIFLGKFLANFVFLSLLESFLLFLAFILTGFPLHRGTPALAGVFILVNLGYSAAGTIISALVAREKGAALIYPILLYPLLVPLFIAAVSLTNLAVTGGAILYSPWLRLVVLFDILFFNAGLILFEFAAEE